jgi:hypothetical protein
MHTQNSRLSHDGAIIEKYDIDFQYDSQYIIFIYYLFPSEFRSNKLNQRIAKKRWTDTYLEAKRLF